MRRIRKNAGLANSLKRRFNKRPSGSVIAEISAGCILMIGLAMFALDIGGAMVCYGINDRACRDAARAAAQGSSSTEANQLAKAIVGTYKPASSLVSAPTVVNVVYNDFGGTPPDGVSPFVAVTTRAVAKPIAPFGLFGNSVVSGSFPMNKTYAFPIVKLNVHV